MITKILFYHLASTCSGSQVSSPLNKYCLYTNLPTTPATSVELRAILQILFAILGAISVLFVTIGGLRYAASGGDPQSMKEAKNTIIFAVVGLVVAISAEAIVTFLLGYLK